MAEDIQWNPLHCNSSLQVALMREEPRVDAEDEEAEGEQAVVAPS